MLGRQVHAPALHTLNVGPLAMFALHVVSEPFPHTFRRNYTCRAHVQPVAAANDNAISYVVRIATHECAVSPTTAWWKMADFDGIRTARTCTTGNLKAALCPI